MRKGTTVYDLQNLLESHEQELEKLLRLAQREREIIAQIKASILERAEKR